MGAYNWILISACCPECRSQVELRCQTHIASSFDGTADGRFHDREYRLGEKMRWWPETSKLYKEWRDDGLINGPVEGPIDYECCYTSCPKCGAALFAAIRFEDVRPVAVEQVGAERNWPSNYWR